MGSIQNVQYWYQYDTLSVFQKNQLCIYQMLWTIVETIFSIKSSIKHSIQISKMIISIKKYLLKEQVNV